MRHDRAHAGAVFCLAAALLLAGCNHTTRGPPIFSVDLVKHWFEGDLLVVNVTFTNRANFTPGVADIPPQMYVLVEEWRTKPEPGPRAGTDLQYVINGTRSFTLHLTSQFSGEWEERWYDEKTVELLDVNRTRRIVGPMLIRPNETIQAEFGFLPVHNFSGNEGFYVVRVRIDGPSYPKGWYDTILPEVAPYFSGCFNRDTAPYYGVREDGPDCKYWDNTGTPTEGSTNRPPTKCPPPRGPGQVPPDPEKPYGC